MVFKTHNTQKTLATVNQGFTLIEFLVGAAILSSLAAVLIYFVNPAEMQAKARDQKRLSDLNSLELAILSYRDDFGVYPDTAGVLRSSILLPGGALGPLENIEKGWLRNLDSRYMPLLPTDPINDSTYNYQYTHSQYGYELSATLENNDELMVSDGGNNPNLYEVGNDLTLIP